MGSGTGRDSEAPELGRDRRRWNEAQADAGRADGGRSGWRCGGGGRIRRGSGRTGGSRRGSRTSRWLGRTGPRGRLPGGWIAPSHPADLALDFKYAVGRTLTVFRAADDRELGPPGEPGRPAGGSGRASSGPPTSILIDGDGDAFDDVAGDLAAAAVVEAGGAGIGVAGQVLHVLQSTDRLHPK